MNTLFIIKVNILELIKLPCRSCQLLLTIEPGMVNRFLARSPISFKHMMPFWCPFIDPHLTAHHSNIGV